MSKNVKNARNLKIAREWTAKREPKRAAKAAASAERIATQG